MNTDNLQMDLQLDLDLDILILLNILDKTTRKYMEAFELKSDDIELCSEVLRNYQGFKKITAYYMNDKDECISFVIFSFDWEQYKLVYQTDDPDIIMNRKLIMSASPEQILKDACDTIKKKVNILKKERNYKYTRMVYTYADEIRNNKQIIDEIRKKGKLVPFKKDSINYSKEMEGYKTLIESSITENTLTIDFVM